MHATTAVHASQIVAWGTDTFGDTVVPANLTNAVGIFAANNNSAALKPDGTVFEWGDDIFGKTIVPPSLTNAIALSLGGDDSVALRSDGTVTAWGFDKTVPSSATNITAISAGGNHVVTLTADGKILSWGANLYGETNVPAIPGSIIAVAAGDYHSMALNNAGQVFVWGSNLEGETNIPLGLSNVVAITAGPEQCIALKFDGTVTVWGHTSQGEGNVPAGLSNVVAVAAGDYHVIALKADGHVVAWGQGAFGQTTVPVSVTNAVGVAGGSIHSIALLNDGSPVVARQPATQAIDPGTTLRLNVGAVGASPLYFQWMFEGSAIPDETNSALTIPNFASTNAGDYSVIVSNALNVVTSSTAVVTFGVVPQMMVQPTNQYLVPGGTAKFTASASGSPTLMYQWIINGTAMSGGTNASLTITNVQASDTGNYQLVVSNAFGSATSQSALLSVVTNAPVFSSQPPSQIVQVGSNAIFSATVVSGSTPAWQWRSGGVNIAGATKSSLTVVAQLTNAGTYDVVATNLSGATTSQPAFLDVFARPQSVVVGPGTNASFSSSYTGPMTLSIHWSFNGSILLAATNTSLNITSPTYADTGDYVIIYDNGAAVANSSVARLSVIDPTTNTNGPMVLPSGMIDWWPGDGNGNDIYGGNNITNQSGLRYIQGQVQQGFVFTNVINSFIGVSNVLPPWTACFWINRQNAGGDSAALFMGTDYSLKIEQYPTTRKVGITKYGSAGNPGWDLAYNYIAPTNTWVHLTFVGTPTETMLFVNGLFQDTLPVNQPLSRRALTSPGGFDVYKGSVDEVMVFNRALTDNEIYAVAAVGRAGLVKAPEFLQLAPHNDGSVGLNLRGQTGKSISVYFSSNLVDWLLLGTQSNPNGAIQLMDVPTSLPIFYRASQP